MGCEGQFTLLAVSNGRMIAYMARVGGGGEGEFSHLAL